MSEARRVRRAGPAFALTVLALLLMLPLSPSAKAQSPALSGPAGEAIPGPVGEAIKKASGIAGTGIQDTTASGGNAVGETGVTVGEIIDENTGTGLGDTLGDAAKDGGTAVKETGGTVGRVVKDTGNSVGDQVDEALNDTPLGDGEPAPGDGDGRDPDKEGSRGPDRTLADESSALGTSERQTAPAESLGLLASGDDAPTQAVALAPAFTVADGIREAIEAAKLFAFPLALTLLVVGFMLIQNKIDKKDPKLALAAVDTTDELLSFS